MNVYSDGSPFLYNHGTLNMDISAAAIAEH